MAEDGDQINQDEIEELLRQAQAGGGPSEPPTPRAAPVESYALDQSEIEALIGGGASAAAAASAGAHPGQGADDLRTDVDYLLAKAEQALASIDEGVAELPEGVQPFGLEDFGGAPASTEAATLELVRDVQLDLKIELGRTHMHLEDVLRLKRGAVVPLDKLAGDPVDLYVNGRLIARGEVLVLNDNFCVRVTELVAGQSVAA